MKDIKSDIEKNRKNFLLHNIVRLREMIRYLPPEKLTLFKEIPFLVHVNSPEFPGYVKTGNSEKIFGVWNFGNSGFAKDIAERNPSARSLLDIKCNNPAVQAIYHIGSLGTFTQSAKSDFDFWVVIDRPGYSESEDAFLNDDSIDNAFINILHEKLSLITTYSRKSFSQEVTFFVHYAHNLRDNIFDNPDDEETVAVPELLLKEEFYRTFIMVAGKIPLWAVQPFGLSASELDGWKQQALDYGGFIDLGSFDSMPVEEIQRGLLWQICKAPYDPVKSVIKASITASYMSGCNITGEDGMQKNRDIKKNEPVLLCDMVKQRFGESIIDDYAADPYIIAFERIMEFYTKLGDQRAISQIKAAIFFRLCGFPVVSLPPKDSPKRRILERYVRKWQLGSARLKKLLEYQSWPESEKSLFDQTMIERLSLLYKASLGKTSPEEKNGSSEPASTGNKRHTDLKILKNKVSRITIKKKGVLPGCSTYLRLKPQNAMFLLARENPGHAGSQKNPPANHKNSESKHENNSIVWLLFSRAKDSISRGSQTKSDQLLYTSPYFMEVTGWSMYNHLYLRGITLMDIKSPFGIYGSFERSTDCDEIYLSLQPWMPLSDEPFISEPLWEKAVVLLFVDNSKGAGTDEHGRSRHSCELPEGNNTLCRFERAEFLARNSWGEIFFEVLDLGHIVNPDEKCYLTAMKILEYNEKDFTYSLFQMASKPIPMLIQRIKTIVEDTKILRNTSGSDSGTNIIPRRPYLDVI